MAKQTRMLPAALTTHASTPTSMPSAPSTPAADPAATVRVVSQIAAALESLDLAEIDDAELFRVIAGWEHVTSAATARQNDAIREVIARRHGRQGPYVADEVACALGTTQYAGDAKVALAVTTGALPALSDALLTGKVDARKAAILAEHLTTVSLTRAEQILETVLPVAAATTGPQLRALVRREILAGDPEQARARTVRARSERRVELTAADDAMAWVSAYLPAEDALVVYTVVEALAARTDATPDDPHEHFPGTPCEPVTCTWSQLRSAARHGGDDRTSDQRRADAFTDVFTALLDAGTGPRGRPLPRRHGARATVQVAVAATTLLGLDQLPGELVGYGPIPAPLARQIAQDATWMRVLTDPATGVALEHGTTRYRPGADLTRTVIARDVTCTFPGCRRPAGRCDLDHIVPFDPTRPAAEQTVEDNLHALCRRHHRAKTHTGWGVTRESATGRTTWTSPAGLTYARSPVPVIYTPAATGRTRLTDSADPQASLDRTPTTRRGPTSTSATRRSARGSQSDPTGGRDHPPPRPPSPSDRPPPF
ncbi:MAG: DUF222 domain-containing protein [Cellulomonadaceae bacterium]|nr:DUF222 domain-containing protein [Cellulomonadaceae bacterium]